MKLLILYALGFLACFGIGNHLKNVPNEIAVGTTTPKIVNNEKNEIRTLVRLPRTNNKLPCLKSSTDILSVFDSNLYSKEILDEVSELTKKIEEELKAEMSPEEEEKNAKRIEANENHKSIYKKNFPRFQISESSRDDFLYYGIQTGQFSDPMRFLGERACASSELSWINNDIGYLGLFFSLNHGRAFGGIIRILNEKNVTPIEGGLSIAGPEEYFESKLVPGGNFRAEVHDEAHSVSNYTYEDHTIGDLMHWRLGFLQSPWLYNSCNKTIATISNFCSYDPAFDMELKEFVYLTDHDLMLGNIYCKKSFEKNWTRIAALEFVRTR